MRGPSLAVWGGGSARPLCARPLAGVEVVSWPGAETGALTAAGVPFRTLEQVLGPGGLAAAAAAGRSWSRVWARLPLVDGRSFRDLVQWRGESLLWTAEAFLRTATAGPRCAQMAELCSRLLETLRPSEVDAYGLATADAVLLARAATACGVLFHGEPGTARPLASVEPPARSGVLRWLFRGFVPKSSPRLEAASSSSAPRCLLVLAREEDRTALRPLERAAHDDPWAQLMVVPPDALPRFGNRLTRRAVADGEERLRERLATLRGTPAVAASYVHRGVGFADLASRDLEAVLVGRLPRALCTLEHAAALLESARPALVVIAVADRDERRTLGMAAGAAGAPWATLQLREDPEDEPDRADGGPHPILALGLGADASELLARLREAARDRVSAP